VQLQVKSIIYEHTQIGPSDNQTLWDKYFFFRKRWGLSPKNLLNKNKEEYK